MDSGKNVWNTQGIVIYGVSEISSRMYLNIINYLKMNKTSDFDIKKSFTFLHYQELPTIFIDEYWDYYMKTYKIESEYKEFSEKYKSDGFEGYVDFIDKFNDVIIKGSKLFLKKSLQDTIKSLMRKCEGIDENWISKYSNPLSENIIKIDIHSAAEVILKRLDLFNDKYESGYDLIDKISDFETFKNSKTTRIGIFRLAGLHENEYLFMLMSNILLKDLYNSENSVIKLLNSSYQAQKTKCDALIYKTGNEFDSNLCGEYEYKDMKYSIDCLYVNDMEILGKTYRNLWISPNHLFSTYKMSPMFIPISNCILNGRTPTKYDTAVGYEDRVFFHLTKDDYKIII